MKLLRKIGSYLLGDARSSERRIATLMLSVRPSVRPSIHLSVCLFVWDVEVVYFTFVHYCSCIQFTA